MIGRMRLMALVTLTLVGIGKSSLAASDDIMTYAGGTGSERFTAVAQLSDGSVLVGGAADDLRWIPDEVPRTPLDGSPINGSGTGKIGFLLHLSKDLRRIQRVVHYPKHVVVDIRFIKTTNAPGKPPGEVLISGMREGGEPREEGTGEGYFIAKLNGNFVSKTPTGALWVKNIRASGSHQENQPWDVGSDGKVYYAHGDPFGHRWAGIYRLEADGTLGVVEHWRTHWGAFGEWQGTPASSRPGVTNSGIVFKITGRGCLRSGTQQEYSAVLPDGNGGTRQGTWPLDCFFAGPFNFQKPAESPGGPGYTGCRVGKRKTMQVGAIVVDRRTNHLYFGMSIQSQLPDKKTDYEPAVVAMSDSGKLKWWSRLHTESKQNSPAWQFVDGLAVDYSQPPAKGALVVAARCRGNSPANFWPGNKVAHPDNPGHAFQNSFTGTRTRIHVSWLGRLALNKGTLLHCSYVGEYAEKAELPKKVYRDPNLDNWPDHNAGQAELNTTTVRPTMHVDRQGRIYLLGTGQRTITTRNAYQKMVKPGEGAPSWNNFVRVYARDLTTLVYSSLVVGDWNKKDGSGGGNTTLLGVCPTAGGVLVVGHQHAGEVGKAKGNPVPTRNVSPWGASKPSGESALFGRLLFAGQK